MVVEELLEEDSDDGDLVLDQALIGEGVPEIVVKGLQAVGRTFRVTGWLIQSDAQASNTMI